MKIKVCGLTEQQNVKKIIHMQPDFMGLVFYPHSKRYVENDIVFSAYISTIEGVKKVGVFVDEQEDIILERVAMFCLDIVQLHGHEPPDVCRRLAQVLPVWKAFSIDDKFDFGMLSAYLPYCQHFLFDTPSPLHGGSGKPFDWNILQRHPVSLPFFLSGGIAAGDMEKIVRFAHPYFEGIDVNSCFETSPGLKNIKLLNTFMHEIRNWR